MFFLLKYFFGKFITFQLIISPRSADNQIEVNKSPNRPITDSNHQAKKI